MVDTYGNHHWRIFRSSCRNLAWVEFEPTTTWIPFRRSNWLSYLNLIGSIFFHNDLLLVTLNHSCCYHWWKINFWKIFLWKVLKRLSFYDLGLWKHLIKTIKNFCKRKGNTINSYKQQISFFNELAQSLLKIPEIPWYKWYRDTASLEPEK